MATTPAVTSPGLIGAAVRRKEDLPLLTGRGRFLDDLRLPGMLHLAVVRSPHAHAGLTRVALDEARRGPGVVAAYAAADLPELGRPIPPYGQLKLLRDYVQPVLARDTVRYAGEPVAAVVAETAYLAADGAAVVAVGWEPRPAATTVEEATGPVRVHADWPDNLPGRSRVEVGQVEAALAGADLVLTEHLHHPRLAGMPLEPRGVVAYEDPATGTLVVITSTQTTYLIRDAIAEVLELPVERVRVLAPDVGGGFGAKAQTYAEELLVPAVARRLGRPVKWVEGRREHFVATCHDREQVHRVRIGFRRDGTIVGIDGRVQADLGAYPIQSDAVTVNTLNHLCAAYRVRHYRNVCENIVTHKTYAAAYRGAGRPEAAFVMERLLDIAARRLGLDPAEIRRRNLIRPEEMPYRPGLLYKDGVEIVYDPADFPAAFERVLARLDYAGLRRRQAAAGPGPRRLGIGLGCYLQGTALGPYEGANVRVDPGGQVWVLVGFSSQGQGHATTFAQICAEELGVPLEAVTVVGADTAVLPYGIGALASRVAANAGPAVARAAREARQRAALVAASLLECAAADVRMAGGRLFVAGLPGRSVTLAQVARAAAKSRALAPTGQPGLNTCAYFYPRTVTWAFGAQAAAVEVDVETGQVRVVRYVAVHDSGRAINPAVVIGQLQGGVAQGLGGALLEELVYDRAGQLLTGSLMDYGLPRADDLPELVVEHLDHPSAINELGIKGVGESGAIAPGGVIANAVEDALAPFGVTVRELPVTPRRIVELLARARATGEGEP